VSQAGAESPHLDHREREQAADRAPLGPLVIHEIVREQGLAELHRDAWGLAWSGLAAGLSIGFSVVTEAHLRAGLPDAASRHTLESFGYTIGFLIVILGRQELFTETTLTALIPTLTRPSLGTVRAMLRVWAIVLAANILGTFAFGAISAQPGVFAPEARQAMLELGKEMMAHPAWQTAVRAGSAGWLMGLMVWLLPSAGAAQPFIIVLVTWVIALCGFPHIVAGSTEASLAVVAGEAGAGDYVWRFFLPTLAGNIFGGCALAALLNHAPVITDLQRER
jgi:formate/nitrite transporter FocA (FNT family)